MIPMLRVGKLCWGPTLLPCQFHLQEPSQNRDKSGLFVGRGGGAKSSPGGPETLCTIAMVNGAGTPNREGEESAGCRCHSPVS